MKEYTGKLLEKAADTIEAAEILLDNDKAEIAVGRAYYAMFYVAEALLNEKALRFSKHGNVHAAYGEHFAKTKILDPKFHRWLMNSFDVRQIGDYAVDTDIEPDDARIVIEQAREFMAAANDYLRKTTD
jgi:uncharacterized protein (UPF0332 family)